MRIIKLKPAQKNKVVSFFAFLSILVNISSPIIVGLFPAYVYASSESAETEDTSTGSTPTGEQNTPSGGQAASEESDEDTSTGSVSSADPEPEETEDTEEETGEEEEPAGEILPTAASDYKTENEPIDESDTSTSSVSDDVAEEISEEVEEVEESADPQEQKEEEKKYDELTDDREVVDSTDEDWDINEDENFAETKDEVKIGVKYIFPLDDEVTVIFTKLPAEKEDRSKLKIEKVKISDLDLPEDFETDSEYAFDITTDMDNGEFEFDLTLPKPEGTEAEVVYIEKSVDEAKEDLHEDDIKKVDEDKVDQDTEDDGVKVEDLDHMTIYVVAGTVGSTSTDPSASSAAYYLRYVGNPAPSGYAHNYQWADPFYVCDPNSTEVVFSGDIDVSDMAVGDVAFVGLLDKGYLEDGNSGFMSGAYAYLLKKDASHMKIGPTDGNNNSEIVDSFKEYEIPDDGIFDLEIRIYDGDISVKVDDDSAISDTYGDVKTMNNSGVYAWDEFEYGAIPGWDNWPQSDMPYDFDLSGCSEVMPSPEWPDEWSVPECNTDPSDESPSQLDILGDEQHPGVYYDTDGNYLYLRERIEGDPNGSGKSMYTKHNWVVVVDQDGDNYHEFILSLNGKDEKVQIWQETSPSGPIDWDPIFNDSADTLVWEGDASTYSRIDSADGSNWFVSWAVPLSHGSFTLSKNADLYFASSADGNNANKDHLSCYGPQEPDPVCGDGMVNGEEDCDDGNDNDNDTCTNNCSWNPICEPDFNMAINGGFETPEVTHEKNWNIFPSNSSGLGWFVEWYGGSTSHGGQTRPDTALLELHRGVKAGWDPSEGAQYAELDTDWVGPDGDLNGEPASVTIYQDIPTIDGFEYKVEFAFSARPDTDGANNNLELKVDGTIIDTYSAGGGSNTSWEEKSYTFTGDGGLARIQFTDLGTADSLGTFIDDVRVFCEGYEKPEYQCDATVYTANNSSDLSHLDTVNGKVHNIDTLDFGSSASADDPFNARTYYVSRYSTSFLKYYDHATESNVDVGATGISSSFFTKLAFNIYGSLFGLADDHKLYEISLSSGTATLLGTVSGISTGGDIVFDEANTLYLMGTDGKLYTVDMGSLNKTLVKSTGLSPVTGLAYVGGEFYISTVINGSSQSDIYKMDKDGSNLTKLNDEPQTKINDLSSCLPGVKPVCGDGVLNQTQGIEQCDGSDGVTPGIDFCTPNCQLIRIYDGEHSCPKGTTERYLDTLTLDSRSSTPVGYSFLGNKYYLLKAMGTYKYANNSNKLADAAYGSNDGLSTWRTDIGIWGTNKGVTSIIGDLGKGYGVIEWDNDQNIDSDHVYEKLIHLNDSYDAEFVISDWYGDWYDNNCDGQSCLGDNTGSLDLEVYECVPTTTVKICKEDPKGKPLQGWTMVLRGDFVETVAVQPDGGVYKSSDLPEDNYALLSHGTYEYRGSSGLLTDPGYSERAATDPYSGPFFPWINVMDLGTPGALGIMVDGSATNWSDYYNPAHRYALGYTNYSGDFEFDVYDNYYGDNKGTMYVDIYEGQVGVTGRDGCVEFDEIVEGDYVVEEIEQFDWEPQGPTQIKAQISDENNKFTFVNKYIAPANIIATKVVCTDEADLPNWGNGHSDITATTATDWVNSHKSCRLEPDWYFEWGPKNSGNPGDAYTGPAGGKYTMFGPTDSNGVATTSTNKLGKRLELREVLQENYIPFTYLTEGKKNTNNVSAEFYCGNDVKNYDNWEWINNPEYGDTIYCVGFNAPKLSDLHGYKWHDLNRNGERDCLDDEDSLASVLGFQALEFGEVKKCEEYEPKLSGWEIFIDTDGDSEWDEGEKKTTTSSEDSEHFGWYWFEDLLPGTYRICEVQQEGWYQTYPFMRIVETRDIEPTCHTVTLPDESLCRMTENAVMGCEYDFGNAEESELFIEGSNDGWPTVMGIGSTFTYTFVVRASKGPVGGVTFTNLPPVGIVPQSGTFSANSSTRGPLDTSGVEYHSPGVWDLGDLESGEEVTISYTAEVTSGVDGGVYPDLGWAQGIAAGGSTILAQATGTGGIDDNYVGTEIEVALDNPGEDSVEVDEREEEVEEGDVLGASTMLPATGISNVWMLVILGLGTIGGLFIVLSGGLNFMKKDKTLKTLALFFGLSLIFSTKAWAAGLIVRLETPKTPTGEEFKLTFVTMDIEDREIAAECYVKKPGEATFSVFETHTVISGGNSHECNVNSAVLTTDGTYEFKVKVSADGDVDESGIVSVDYDGEGPERPKYIEKDKKSSCKYEITFKTHQDGDTAYVEVYRDFDKDDLDINAGTRIRTITIGPSEKHTFDETLSGSDCGKTPYYAVRAFDIADNPSGVRAETVVKKVTISSGTTTITSEETGAVEVFGGDIFGAATGTGGPEEPTDVKDSEGTVLGETNEETKVVEMEDVAKKPITKKAWFWMLVLAGFFGAVGFVRSKKKD